MEKLSANEINKFTYCRYQWYYERKYGRKSLREQRAELLKSLGLDDSTQSNFVKGLEFHNNYGSGRRLPSLVRLICVILLLALIIAFIFNHNSMFDNSLDSFIKHALGVLPWIF